LTPGDRPHVGGRSFVHHSCPNRATVLSCAKPMSVSQARRALRPSAPKTTTPPRPLPDASRLGETLEPFVFGRSFPTGMLGRRVVRSAGATHLPPSQPWTVLLNVSAGSSYPKHTDLARAKPPSASLLVNDAHTVCQFSGAKRRTLLHHRRYRVYRFCKWDTVPAVNRSGTRSQLRQLSASL
jgi:hypothetical protein